MADTLNQTSGPSPQHNSDTSTRTQPCCLSYVDPQAQKRSEAIDRTLEEDAKTRERRASVLPLGAFSMREIVNQLKNHDEIGLTEDELIDCRHNIYQFVDTCIKSLVDLVKAAEVQLEEDVNRHFSYLRSYIAVSRDDASPSEQAGRAIDAVWNNSSIREMFQSSVKSDLKSPSAYFFREISRIAAPDYIPTEADIVQSRKGIRGVSEHRFHVDGLTLSLVDVGTQRCERRKWIHQFENVTAVLYMVDLPCYDQEASGTNAMAAQIEYFDNAVSSKWFANAKFVLFLNNVTAFRRKLVDSPLGAHFLDFLGGTNSEQACEYLLQRFRRVNRGRRRLYSHLVDPHVASNIELVAAAINDDS